MRKIVYAVYHNCNKEERSKELLMLCKKLGEVHFVSYAKPDGVDGIKVSLIDKSSPFALFNFLKTAKKVIKKENPDVVVLHDNDCSALIPFVRKKFPNTKIVYDSSELYIDEGLTKKKNKGNGIKIKLKAKLTSFRKKCEKKYLKDADVVIAANEERAEIMQRYFGLREMPIVFDNMHRIDLEYDKAECDKKFGHAFDDGKFNILFAGGINEERETFAYIEAFAKVADGCRLIIVGAASPVARARYEKMLDELGLDGVVYLGFITRAELRYCMTRSSASVVIFDKDSYNTKYCASGKCYESLFEGVPILASENPPLKRLCQTYNIGISNDRFDEAITALKDNYEFYRRGVEAYVGGLSYESRVDELAASIERKLK